MVRSIAVLFCFFLTLVSQSAGATNYHVYRKFEAVCHDNQLRRCSRHKCTSVYVDVTQDFSSTCQRSLELRFFGAIAFPGGGSEPDAPAVSAFKSVAFRAGGHGKAKCAGGPIYKEERTGARFCGIAKWHKALLARLARYKRYPRKRILPREWSVSRSPSIGRATS